MSVGEAGPSPGGGPSRRAVEVLTAVVVAVVVASGVVAVGVVTRDDPQNTADPGPSDSSSPTPDTADPETTPPEEPDDPDVESTAEETAEPTVEAEVTDVELEVDQPEYTGPCPVTLEFSARITTNTGPVRADVEWRDADSNEVEGEFVQFGGPGLDAEPVPQGVTVTHTVDVHDDATVQRTVAAIDPNEVTSNTVDATVTCTPYAEITKGGDDFEPDPESNPDRWGCHLLAFDATITVPHDMTVEYQWIRTDGPVVGPLSADFTSGGTQTQAIPGQTWMLGNHDGDFGYQIHILEPYDVMSELVTYDVPGCSGPAS